MKWTDAEDIGIEDYPDACHFCGELGFDVVVENAVLVKYDGKDGDKDRQDGEHTGRNSRIAAREITPSIAYGRLLRFLCRNRIWLFLFPLFDFFFRHIRIRPEHLAGYKLTVSVISRSNASRALIFGG